MNNFRRCPCGPCLSPIKYGIDLGVFVSQSPSQCLQFAYLLLVFQMRFLRCHTQLHGTSEILRRERRGSMAPSVAPAWGPLHWPSAISSVWFPCPAQGQHNPSTCQRMAEGDKTAEMAGASLNWDISAWWSVVPFWKPMPEPTGEMEITCESSKSQLGALPMRCKTRRRHWLL